jgi:alpha-galactosidase
MIPAMVDIARDVLDLAPQALFFNYSNPMAAVCRGVRKATGANVVGLCHGVPGTARYLAEALNVPPEALTYTAVGINHLTWFTSLRAQGQDAMPRLREIAAQKLAAGVDSKAHAPEDPSDAMSFPYEHLFSWELLLRFGAFPAPLDRHVTEFFPQFFRYGKYYGRTLGVDAFSFEATIAEGDMAYAGMEKDAFSPDPLRHDYFDEYSGEHEQVMEIIAAIRGDQGLVYSTNLPNQGQVPNLPQETIVESPAIADATGFHPIAQPPLPNAMAGALATRCSWVETIVQAALEGSRDQFIQALVLDGYVESLDVAARLADDLLASQADYLPWVTRR